MITKLGNVFYRVPDMDAAVAFYRDVLGLPLTFRDGDSWAAFDVAGTTLALEGGAPGGPGGATASLKVDDLAATAAAITARGGQLSPIVRGGHEWRAVVTDPAGNQLALYQPAPAAQLTP